MSRFSEGRRVPPNDHKDNTGISPLDLDSLPPVPRKIMRLILRKPGISEPDLRAAVEALPGPDRPGSAELDSLLADMLDRQWLLESEEGQPKSYRVNLRRKAVRALTRNLWDALDATGTPRRPAERKSDGTPEH